MLEAPAADPPVDPQQIPLDDRTQVQQRAVMGVRDVEQTGENSYSATIMASEFARDPIQLVFEGLSTVNYMKNPVVLWAHNYITSQSGGVPIAKTIELAVTGPHSLRADFEFLEGDEFAGRVKNAWDRGFLRAASISWYPIEYETTDTGWRDLKSDMLEWSIVPVPADPDALREAHGRAMEALIRAPEENGIPILDLVDFGENDLAEALLENEDLRKMIRQMMVELAEEADNGITLLGGRSDESLIFLTPETFEARVIEVISKLGVPGWPVIVPAAEPEGDEALQGAKGLRAIAQETLAKLKRGTP